MGTSVSFLGAMAAVQAARQVDAIGSAERLLAALSEKSAHLKRKADELLAAARGGAPIPGGGTREFEALRQAAIRDALPRLKRREIELQAALLARPLPMLELPDMAAQAAELNRRLAAGETAEACWRRLVRSSVETPRTAFIYAALRRSLWRWPEFAGVRRGARAILEVVIELARDEGFPWYVPVQSQEVRKLARLAEGSFTRSVRELLSLAVTRPARRASVVDAHGRVRWPAEPEPTQKPEPTAQWVVRYRRGVPWHANRAAWWINLDLLCESKRALPGFIVELRSLSAPYQSRNHAMGGRPAPRSSDALADMERSIALCGPTAPIGLRAALWSPPAGTPLPLETARSMVGIFGG